MAQAPLLGVGIPAHGAGIPTLEFAFDLCRKKALPIFDLIGEDRLATPYRHIEQGHLVNTRGFLLAIPLPLELTPCSSEVLPHRAPPGVPPAGASAQLLSNSSAG